MGLVDPKILSYILYLSHVDNARDWHLESTCIIAIKLLTSDQDHGFHLSHSKSLNHIILSLKFFTPIRVVPVMIS